MSHQSGQNILCDCGENAIMRKCAKNGPNYNRPFWTCPNGSCKFFRPADNKPWIANHRPDIPQRQDDPGMKRHRIDSDSSDDDVPPPPPPPRNRKKYDWRDPTPFLEHIVGSSAKCLELVKEAEILLVKMREQERRIDQLADKMSQMIQ